MVKVMATGVFDILHLGHLYFLQEAKKLGEELIVVATNQDQINKPQPFLRSRLQAASARYYSYTTLPL